MFNISDLTTKIEIGNVTKWLYIGAKDITPYKKKVIDLNTINYTVMNTSKTIGILNQNFKIDISNEKYNDLIMNEYDLNATKTIPLGIGIVKLGVADLANYSLTKIYTFAFSVVDNNSNFNIGFFSWFGSFIIIDNKNAECNIIIQNTGLDSITNESIINLSNFSFRTDNIYYVFQNNNENTFSFYENEKMIANINMTNIVYKNLIMSPTLPLYCSLKTLCTLSSNGTNNTKLRIYSQDYINNIANDGIKNMINNSEIVWFGLCTQNNQNINNTSDYKILSVKNNSAYFEPALQINNLSNNMMGFCFSVSRYSTNSTFNSNGFRLGFADDEIINSGTSTLQFSLFEIQIFDDRIVMSINDDITSFIKSPSFNPNDIYHLFINNNENWIKIYENCNLIFYIDTINTTTHDYVFSNTDGTNRLANPLYLFLSGDANLKIINAPYAYTNSTSEIKILVDYCSNWVSCGGSNIGPILEKKITSNYLFNDKKINDFFTDPFKGKLSNFSSVSLYLYLELLKNLELNANLDLTPFLKLIVIDDKDKGYTQTINNLNLHFKENVTKYFDSLTKITDLNIEKKDLVINGYNTFLDNS
jgi:hypothetical protein